MEQTYLFVKSSTEGESYRVNIRFIKGVITVQCNCRAGIHGQMCKHKSAVIVGDKTVLFNEADLDDFRKIQKWIESTTLRQQLLAYQEKLKLCDEEKANIETRIKTLKGEFASKLQTGIE